MMVYQNGIYGGINNMPFWRSANIMTEEQLHAECYQWFHATFIPLRKMLFHVDNNSWNAAIGAKKKALGVVQGVSDFIFIVDFGVHFIEMKTGSGNQSKDQKEFMQMVRDRGHQYHVVRTFEEFKTLILELC